MQKRKALVVLAVAGFTAAAATAAHADDDPIRFPRRRTLMSSTASSR